MNADFTPHISLQSFYKPQDHDPHDASPFSFTPNPPSPGPPAATTSTNTPAAENTNRIRRLSSNRGGRPKDFVWNFFSGDRVKAVCKQCSWATERPKAFRMRQHILQCPRMTDDIKESVKQAIDSKEQAQRVKEQSNNKLGLKNKKRKNDLTTGNNNNSGGNNNNNNNNNGSNNNDNNNDNKEDQQQHQHQHQQQHQHQHQSQHQQPPLSLPPSLRGIMDSPSAVPSNLVGDTSSTNAAAAAASANVTRPLITCHVLDSTSGKPGAEMQINLDHLTATGLVTLATAWTDSEGRCNTLPMMPGMLEPNGTYRLVFHTADYFEKRGISTFFPVVEVTFVVTNPNEHHHVPLLLSPFSYSTYRGS